MHKTLLHLKSFAEGKDFFKTMKAVHVAMQLHQGQTRKTGEPYIEHPMKVANKLKTLRLNYDDLYASALLHDVREDCKVNDAYIRTEFNDNIANIVSLLTKDSSIPTDIYYENILHDPFATLVKIADRCHNVSTMAEAFSKEKIESYIKETNDYVIPLCRKAVIKYPEYSNEIYNMKDHIESVCYALSISLGL